MVEPLVGATVLIVGLAVLVVLFNVFDKVVRWLVGKVKHPQGASFGPKAVGAGSMDVRDPANYVVPFMLVGGPLDGEVREHMLSALTHRAVSHMIFPGVQNGASREEHVYSVDPEKPQVLVFAETRLVDLSAPRLPISLRGDDA